MAKRKNAGISSIADDIIKQLEIALEKANEFCEKSTNGQIPSFAHELNKPLLLALDDLCKNNEKASAAFSNVITSLSIKSFLGDKVDIRYHETQIQNQTNKGAGFNFRGVSENIIYPWMTKHEFKCAKSGWQTRTLERPKPYLLNYDENIGYVKKSFLQIYHQIEEEKQNASNALAYIIWKSIIIRESSRIVMAIPKITDVIQITNLFEQHFNYKYNNSRGASRLPVLALYAIYQVLLDEFGRFNGKKLKALEEHSAADSQTGAIGDIEIEDEQGNIFEALEIKHQIIINTAIIQSAKQKIRGSQIDRYYILTTHKNHEPSEEIYLEVEKVKKLLGCQMIVNGVIPTIKYYLRLLSNPNTVIKNYVKLLEMDKSVEFEHRCVWNKIATGEV